jgi:hypothetical protein
MVSIDGPVYGADCPGSYTRRFSCKCLAAGRMPRLRCKKFKAAATRVRPLRTRRNAPMLSARFQRAVAAAKNEFPSLGNNMREFFADMGDNVKLSTDLMQGAFGSLKDHLSDTFMTGKFEFDSFLESLKKQMADFLASKLVGEFAGFIFGGGTRWWRRGRNTERRSRWRRRLKFIEQWRRNRMADARPKRLGHWQVLEQGRKRPARASARRVCPRAEGESMMA